MSVLKVVQDGPTVTVGSAANTQSTALSVKTGIYRFSAEVAKGGAAIQLGGAANATNSSLYLEKGETVIVKGDSPVRMGITGATSANPVVYTIERSGGNHNQIKVGDYVTVSGAATGAFNLSHVEVTAATPTTFTIGGTDGSGFAAFGTGTAEVRNSMKYAIMPKTSSGSTVHCTEVQVVVS